MVWRVFFLALALHVAFVFALPETWSDGYFHMMAASDFSHGVRAGTFSIADLRSMWLPFFHVAAGVPLLVWDDPMLVPRLVSACFGAGSVAMAFVIARRLNARPWLAALLLALAPLHLFFSSYAMTEAATGFSLMVTLWAFLASDESNRRFLWVPLAMAPAILCRYEVWPLAAFIWLLAITQRRAKVGLWLASAALFAFPAALWMALHYAATGDPLAFFHESREYMTKHFLPTHPEFAVRNVQKLAIYLASIFLAGGVSVVYAILGAIDAKQDRDRRAVAGFFVGNVLVLVALYLVGSNAGWHRYWVPAIPPMMVLAAIGLDGVRFRRALIGVALASYAGVFAFLYRETSWSNHLLEIGAHLRANPPHGRVFCDEAAVILSSRLPRDTFVDNRLFKGGDPSDELKRENVELLVWSGVDYSPLYKLFPDPRLVGDLVFDPPTNATSIKKYNLAPAYLYRVR